MGRVAKKAPQLAVRTGAQAAAPGAVIVLLAVFNVIHWTPEQTSAVMVVAVPVVSFIWNLVEQHLEKRWLR